ERVRVQVRGHVARQAGIRVLAPRAPEAIALFVHGEVGEPGLVELDRAQDAGHAGADDGEAHQGILEHASTAASTAVRVASLASSAICASTGTRSGCSAMYRSIASGLGVPSMLLRWKTSSSTVPSLARSEITRNTVHGTPRDSHSSAIAAV